MDEEFKLIDTQTRAEKVKTFLLDNKKALLSISLGLILIVLSFYYYQTYKTKQTELASNKYNTAVIDYKNVLKCFSIKNGEEIWKVKTEKSFIKSQKKLSLIIVNDVIYFNNSVGDISAVNINNGNLIWQTPTRGSEVLDEQIFLKTSDLIADNDTILFSNNKNEFFSLDITSGTLNWIQKINSSLRPTLVDDIVFSVSLEGFLFVLDKDSGNIIRVTDIFNQFKKKNRSKIKPIGFIVGSKNIYLTTSHGRLIIIDILSGKAISVLKIDKDKISRPFVLNENLYIIKENSVIRLN